MKRVFDEKHPEQMDVPQPVTPELERDLENLVSLNRHFGSHRLVSNFLHSWLGRSASYRVLDLATGAGDIPRLISDWCARRNISVQIDAVDANQATLEIAGRRNSACKNIQWIRENALTFDPGHTYDMVCCSLALHHFSEDDAIRLLRHCNELSHRFVLVADLERSFATTAGVWLLTALLYRDPMTKHDGRLSAQRAFSWKEMHTMAVAAGWETFGHARFLFCRQAIWLSKRDLSGTPAIALNVGDAMPCPG
jgi:2-polyprenyl-3-methyl-5-hydroxy-6-metoxy-1,4-benzoquinol methylase